METVLEQLDDMPDTVRARVARLLQPLSDGMPWLRPIRPREGVVALSPAQQHFAVETDDPGAPDRGQPVLLCLLHGPLDRPALADALHELAGRHSALRIRHTGGGRLGGRLGQEALPEVAPDFVVREASGPDGQSRLDHAMSLAAELARTPFRRGEAPLWRAALIALGQDEHLFVVVAHESVCDLSSARVLARDLSEIYRARRSGQACVLLPLPFGYADFAAWQRERMPRSRRTALSAMRRKEIAGAEPPDLPTDNIRGAAQDPAAAAMHRDLPPEVAHGVEGLAARLAVPPDAVYLAAFAQLLSTYSRQRDLLIGVELEVRDRPELAGLVGCFTTLVPVRVEFDAGTDFAELARRVGRGLQTAGRLCELGPGESSGASPEPVVFGCPGPPATLDLDEVAGTAVLPPAPAIRSDLRLRVRHGASAASVEVAYRISLFDDVTMDRLLGHYVRLLQSALAAPQRPVSAAAMMAAGEREELLRRWNGQYRSVPPAPVHAWFADQARRTPHAIAVIAGGVEVTYAELNSRANRLAHLLTEHITEPGTLVGVHLPRGVDLVVAILAVLKAGAAFVPMEPANPHARNATIIADSKAPLVISTAPLWQAFAEPGVTLVDISAFAAEAAARPDDEPRVAGRVDDLAYVLYTSGSTGTPKGVLIEHRAVVNFIESVRERFGLGPHDRILGYASCGFDVSIFEMFGALLNGATLCMAEDTDRLDPERLQQLLEEQEITVVDIPPAVLALLDPQRLKSLRVCFIGGEAFTGELVNKWNEGRLFVNGYGPTECTVTVIAHDCAGRWSSPPPIGLPLPNHVAHVVDEELELVPYGVPGELLVGGAGLARGYLNRPDLTEAAFLKDPFGTAPGGRLYRTGDLVKRRRDGALVFLGRVDRQTKIRGVRIEPAEIETALAGHPQVRQVFVDTCVDPDGARQLVAYVSLVEGAAARPDELRRHIGGALPPAMVPKYVVEVPELPLNASGKVDRSALPPVTATPQPPVTALPQPLAPQYVTPPRTETERVLADELIGAVLGVPTVDVAAGFFDLGGGSLQAAQVVSGIRRRFEVEISVADFFRDSTVVGLAAFVDRQQALRLDDARLVELLESMSEGEVERMLHMEWAEGERP